MGCRFYLGCSITEYTGTWPPFHGDAHWERQAEKTWGYFTLKCIAPTIGCYSEKKCSIVPTLSSRAKAQRIALEVKQAIKERTLTLLPKDLISFVTERGEVQTLGCSQKRWKWEVVMKGSWEEIGRLIRDRDKTIGWPVFWREVEKVTPGRSLPGDRTNFKHWPKQLTFQKSLDLIVPVYGTIHALRQLLKTIEQSTDNQWNLTVGYGQRRDEESSPQTSVFPGWLGSYPSLHPMNNNIKGFTMSREVIDFTKIIQPITTELNREIMSTWWWDQYPELLQYAI